ncbi:hypothetical protein BsWGS_21883 [Bradybaena similaris]
MASGIKIAEECKQVYGQISITSKQVVKKDWVVFKLSDCSTRIEVERCGTMQEIGSYDKLIGSLPTDDVRYVVVDFEYINKDNCRKSDIILISWHPEGSSVRKKMICAASFSALKAALGNIRNILEGDCNNEVDSKAALEKVGGKAIPTPPPTCP